MARVLHTPAIMIMFEPVERERLGRIADGRIAGRDRQARALPLVRPTRHR